MVDLKVEQQPFAHLERNRVTFRNMTLIEDSYLPLPVVKHRRKANFRDTQIPQKSPKKNYVVLLGFYVVLVGFYVVLKISIFHDTF